MEVSTAFWTWVRSSPGFWLSIKLYLESNIIDHVASPYIGHVGWRVRVFWLQMWNFFVFCIFVEGFFFGVRSSWAIMGFQFNMEVPLLRVSGSEEVC